MQPLNVILFTEDPQLASSITEVLRKARPAIQLKVGMAPGDFAFADAAEEWDAVLASYAGLPETAREVLRVVGLRPSPPPVVFVSTAEGEEHAVECMRAGAAGYVSAGKLERLPAEVAAAVAAGPRRRRRADGDQHIFKQIAEHTRDIIVLHAPDRNVTFVSPSVRTLLGYEPDEWLGRRPSEFLHPEDYGRAQEEIEDALSGRASHGRVVARFRHKEGRYLWLEVVFGAIRDQAGHLAGIISIARDTTERREVEEGLRVGEKLFEGIARANRLLLAADSVQQSFKPMLKVLGEATDADRVVIFELRPPGKPGRAAAGLRAEWVSRPEYSLFSDPKLIEVRLDPFDAGELPRLFSAGGSVTLHVENAPSRVRESLRQLGIVSMVAFPIAVGSRVWGGMAFHQCERHREWPPAVCSALGALASTIGQVIDRENALAALAASEQQYEALLESLSEGVFQIDLEARWRFLNPTWEDITGYRVSECIGRRFSEFLREEDAAESLEGFGRLVSGRESRVETELCFTHRDGSERWLRVIARPQEGPDGRITGMVGTLVDVTQRRHAQEALEASERKFAAVFASASDALFLVDRETGLIVECNPRALEMFECDSSSQLLGIDGNLLRAEPTPPEEIGRIRERVMVGEKWSQETEYVTLKGRRFWGQVAVSRMEPASLGTMLVRVTDITELKQSEARLRASLGEKEVLLKEVYHRVKNNLQIISALLRMQTRRVKDQAAIEALEHSIGRVMAMSMVHEKLYQAQNLVSIDFRSFAQSLVGFLNQLTVGSGSEVSIHVRGEALALSIDQAIPMGLVLNELVTNSIKYAFPDGTGAGVVSIDIGTSEAGEARVVVEDNGIGLPAGVDPESSSGLGFRIVRMLVEQLHGGLQFESHGGLKVTVYVPLASRAAEPMVST